MLNKEKSGNYLLKIIAIILCIIIVLSASLIAVNVWEKKQGLFKGGDFSVTDSTIDVDGKKYTLKNNIETFLIIGLDKTSESLADSYNNNLQADFLILLVIDNEKSQYTAVHINRDTMADINILGVSGDKVGTTNKQIALAHTYGNGREVSCRNTADAVSNLLMGAKIDHFISVKMDAVPVMNDLVGGVEVEVLEDFSSIDQYLIKGQRVTLNGEQALTYVRTRYGLEDPSNNTRMVRQQQYIKAFYEAVKIKAQSDKSFVTNASLKMTDYLVSDCSSNKLETYFDKMQNFKLNKILDFEGETKKGETFMEFYPNEDVIKQNVIELFYE